RLQFARLGVIQHELADDAFGVFERNERHRGDALGANRRQEWRETGIPGDIRHDERFGALGAWRPRRVSFDGAAITLRELPPCLEAHDAVWIEEKNGRLLDAQSALEGVERRFVNVFETIGAADGVR